MFFYIAHELWFPFVEINAIMYIPAGYIVGYFINTIASIIEPFLFWTIGGRPSDNLLKVSDGQTWTGYYKVKFYEPITAIKLLKKDTKDPEACPDKMFKYAMLEVNGKHDSRVPDFNGQYVFARSVLTVVVGLVIYFEIKYYYIYWTWGISVGVLFLAWDRFKARAYYYAREVLNEYLKNKD